MAIKSKVKPKAKTKSKIKPKSMARAKVSKKPAKKTKAKIIASRKTLTKQIKKVMADSRPVVKPIPVVVASKAPVRTLPKPMTAVVKRIVTPLLEKRRPIKRAPRVNQFAFMKAPGLEHEFDVGDTVEVYCDHEKNHERIRGWVRGIVVQVDLKLVAVQFRSNVYLTDGWMVPDRILWYPVNSEHIRPVIGKKAVKDKREYIPDY